jgi:hypothetical protein
MCLAGAGLARPCPIAHLLFARPLQIRTPLHLDDLHCGVQRSGAAVSEFYLRLLLLSFDCRPSKKLEICREQPDIWQGGRHSVPQILTGRSRGSGA